MADFGGENPEAFRSDVRGWMEANYPAELRSADVRTDPEAIWGGRAFLGSEDPQIVWMRRVAEKGWTAPTWPAAYGGGGLSPDQGRILEQELARGRYRPPLSSFGLWMLGPVLLEYANEAQKLEHLPRIVRGEARWCQGYSEPGAGSDLAGLQTRCEDKGDHWLINGQKVWTSYANKADWCFCLVRTDPTRKHEGISFVLIDMTSPGVETRPIQLISGESPFCETFFTDVRIPKDNLVGPVNGGWQIAKRLLQYERQNISGGFGPGEGAGGSSGCCWWWCSCGGGSARAGCEGVGRECGWRCWWPGEGVATGEEAGCGTRRGFADFGGERAGGKDCACGRVGGSGGWSSGGRGEAGADDSAGGWS